MKTVVIGAGFSGLSAACYMAREGHEVVVLEKNAQVGGRARQLAREGFRFDMGPTFYWMPDIIARFFADFGRTPQEFYELIRLDPSYEIVFGPGDRIALPAGRQAVAELFERTERGSGRFLERFLRSAEFNYRVAAGKAIYRPGRSLLELVMPETVVRAPQFVRSLAGTVRRGVRDERLRRILEFPSLFLGAKPENIPSFYRFMNHADMELGTWHVRGGSAGLVVNLLAGLIGAVLGGWLTSAVGLVPARSLGSLAAAVIGAVVLLWITALVQHRKIRSYMDKKQIDTEERETLELFSERIDSSTAQCAADAQPERADGNAAHPASAGANAATNAATDAGSGLTGSGEPSPRAAGKIDEAVAAAQRRNREKTDE